MWKACLVHLSDTTRWLRMNGKRITLLQVGFPLPTMMVQKSYRGWRAISTRQRKRFQMLPLWGINGGMPSGSTVNGTLTLGALPFLLALPSLPLAGSSREKIPYPLSTPTAPPPLRTTKTTIPPHDVPYLLFRSLLNFRKFPVSFLLSVLFRTPLILFFNWYFGCWEFSIKAELGESRKLLTFLSYLLPWFNYDGFCLN